MMATEAKVETVLLHQRELGEAGRAEPASAHQPLRDGGRYGSRRAGRARGVPKWREVAVVDRVRFFIAIRLCSINTRTNSRPS